MLFGSMLFWSKLLWGMLLGSNAAGMQTNHAMSPPESDRGLATRQPIAVSQSGA